MEQRLHFLRKISRNKKSDFYMQKQILKE